MNVRPVKKRLIFSERKVIFHNVLFDRGTGLGSIDTRREGKNDGATRPPGDGEGWGRVRGTDIITRGDTLASFPVTHEIGRPHYARGPTAAPGGHSTCIRQIVWETRPMARWLAGGLSKNPHGHVGYRNYVNYCSNCRPDAGE